MIFNFPFFFTQKIPYNIFFFYTLLYLCFQYYLPKDTLYWFMEVFPHVFIAT